MKISTTQIRKALSRWCIAISRSRVSTLKKKTRATTSCPSDNRYIVQPYRENVFFIHVRTSNRMYAIAYLWLVSFWWHKGTEEVELIDMNMNMNLQFTIYSENVPNWFIRSIIDEQPQARLTLSRLTQSRLTQSRLTLPRLTLPRLTQSSCVNRSCRSTLYRMNHGRKIIL